jgi:hypothetical protein
MEGGDELGAGGFEAAAAVVQFYLRKGDKSCNYYASKTGIERGVSA